MRKLALGAILVMVCASSASAQVAASGNMVGPLHPILIDTNGDGLPGTGDTPIVPVFNTLTETLTIPNPWENCGPGTGNVLQMQRPIGGGDFIGASRQTDNQTDNVTADQFLGSRPTRFQMNVVKGGPVVKSGTGTVLDQDNDGFYDALLGQGSASFLVQFITANGHVSIPWSQASALGVDTTDNCIVGSGDPQVWIPLADTDGDTVGDSIVLDLDGNNQADPDFRWSPMLAASAVVTAPIPTLAQWGLMAAALGLALAAWLQIRAAGLGA